MRILVHMESEYEYKHSEAVMKWCSDQGIKLAIKLNNFRAFSFEAPKASTEELRQLCKKISMLEMVRYVYLSPERE